MTAALARLGVAALTLTLARLVAAWPTHVPSLQVWEATWGVLAAALAVVSLVPDRWTRTAQDAALLALFVVQRDQIAALGGSLGVWLDLPLGVAVSMLPWGRPGWRTAGISVAALGFVLLNLLPPALGSWTEHTFIQLLFVASLTGGLGLRDAARYTLCCLITPRMTVPPPDVLGVDRSPGSVGTGGAWLLLGLGLARLPLARRLAERDPWALLLDGDLGGGLWDATRLCALTVLVVATRLLVLAGTLRLLGLPVRAPVDAPWRATDMLDWWRRTHAWRSTAFRAAFLQHLGWSGPWAAFLVFLLSGLQHTANEQEPWPRVAVWTTLGLLAAANVALARVVARRRVARWMAGEKRPQPRWWTAALATLTVVLLHGLVLGVANHLEHQAVAERDR